MQPRSTQATRVDSLEYQGFVLVNLDADMSLPILLGYSWARDITLQVWFVEGQHLRSYFAFGVCQANLRRRQLPAAALRHLALAVIKRRLDERTVKPLQSYTYEYREGEFCEVSRPFWWEPLQQLYRF